MCARAPTLASSFAGKNLLPMFYDNILCVVRAAIRGHHVIWNHHIHYMRMYKYKMYVRAIAYFKLVVTVCAVAVVGFVGILLHDDDGIYRCASLSSYLI